MLFPLRQRIIDLQQQLAVNQQAILATKIVVRNNKKLIRGVGRAMNVTVNALKVAVTVAMAAESQKNVHRKVSALGAATTDLLTSTAERLKTQGAEIQKMASAPLLDVEALKRSFADVHSALDDLSRFRINALPKMHEAIRELDQLTVRSAELIGSSWDGVPFELHSARVDSSKELHKSFYKSLRAMNPVTDSNNRF